MAEFTPEYETLMRKLALTREFQEGDWVLEIVTVSGDQTRRWAVDAHGARFWQRAYPKFERRGLEHTYWLPLEGDWLRMLEEAGIEAVTIRFRPCDGRHDEWGYSAQGGRSAVSPVCPTRLEALARLWMAVTGRDA